MREEPLSPGPYRSFRELSLSGLVGSDTWRPPTFVGNPGSSAPTAGAAPHFHALAFHSFRLCGVATLDGRPQLAAPVIAVRSVANSKREKATGDGAVHRCSLFPGNSLTPAGGFD